MNNKKKQSGIFLTISLLFVIVSIIILFIGSDKGSTYNQIKDSPVFTKLSQVKNAGVKPFILQGYINDSSIFSTETIISTKSTSIELEDGSIKLEEGFYYLSNPKISVNSRNTVTIYSVKIEGGVRGYQLFPGNSEDYLEFIWTPFSFYKIYVRILLGLALLFFILSILINIKK